MEPTIFKMNDSEGYLKHLEEYGYVVIGNVLDENKRLELIEKFWEDWTRCSPRFDRYDKTTWNIENSPMMFAKGMAIFSGLPHSDFAWETRLQDNIKGIFENVHKTKDMVVSFDGFSVFFDKKQKPDPWWHVDQNSNNREYSVQGAYNFMPVTKDSAGFVVVPKSHKMKIDAKPGKDWILINDSAVTSQGVKLIIPGNCFVLWNSRTVHANTGMDKKVDKRFDRLTCYITYMPKQSRSEEIAKSKMIAYRQSNGTSHWANRCEVKKYPWGFGPRYETRGFLKIHTNENIPEERMDVI